MNTLRLLTLILFVGAPLSASAQPPFPFPFPGSNNNNNNNNNSSSSGGGNPFESLTESIRSAAESSMASSSVGSAGVEREKTKSMEIDNKLKGARAHYSLQDMWYTNRAKRKRGTPTMQGIASRAGRLKPKSLKMSQYDTVIGRIQWPILLRQQQYTENREKLNDLFRERAAAGGNGDYTVYLEIREVSKALKDQVKEDIDKYPGNDYAQAQRFIDSIAYEGRFNRG